MRTNWTGLRRMGAFGLGALVIALAVTACGGKAKTAKMAEHNTSDVTFAQAMIPHHEQAIEMADTALSTSKTTEVKDLARRIKAAQGPEITKMRGWLKSWDEPVKPKSNEHEGGHTSGGEGMMSEKEMKALANAPAAEFDRQFLEGMIAHHEGAIKMAEEEVDKGEFPDAKKLARDIIRAQKVEIKEMKDLTEK